MIRLENVDKVYRTSRIETLALSGITLDVGEGEFVSVMGPSGCGKSTLLNIIGLLDAPSGGTVQINGAPISSYADRHLAAIRNRDIGFVFQTFHLVSDLTVLDNVQVPLLYRSVSNRERRRLATAALERVGLSARLQHFPSQLSGGQQQRVAIARTLMQRPRLLLADEPVASLDPATSHSVMRYVEQINKEDGITVVCNLHFLSLARRYAQRVLALKDGELVADLDPHAIDPDKFREIYGEDAVEVEVA